MSEPVNCANFTPLEKLKFIEGQVNEVRAGVRKVLLCPYCGGENTKGTEFMCCEVFAKAVEAVLNREEMNDTLDFMGTVADKAKEKARPFLVN